MFPQILTSLNLLFICESKGLQIRRGLAAEFNISTAPNWILIYTNAAFSFTKYVNRPKLNGKKNL